MSVIVRVEKRDSPTTGPLFGIVELTEQMTRRWTGVWRVVVTPGARAIGVGAQYQYWRCMYDTGSPEAEAIAPGSSDYIELWETGVVGRTREETLVLRLDGFDYQTFITGRVRISTGSGWLSFSDHGDFHGRVHWNTVIAASPLPTP